MQALIKEGKVGEYKFSAAAEYWNVWGVPVYFRIANILRLLVTNRAGETFQRHRRPSYVESLKVLLAAASSAETERPT